MLSQLLKGLYLGKNDGMGRKKIMQNDHLKTQEVEGRGMLKKGFGACIGSEDGKWMEAT
jgi:hypothetical protein